MGRQRGSVLEPRKLLEIPVSWLRSYLRMWSWACVLLGDLKRSKGRLVKGDRKDLCSAYAFTYLDTDTRIL